VDLFNPAKPDMAAQYARAQELVTSVRVDDMAGVVKPFGWVLELLRSGGGKGIDTNTVVNRYNWAITRCVLAQFLELGKQEAGSYALAVSHRSLFGLACKAILSKRIAQIINRFAVRPLMVLNGFRLTKKPTLKPSDLTQPQLDDIAEGLSRIMTAGGIVPDAGLEAYLRELGGLPEAEQPEEAPAPPAPPVPPAGTPGPPGITQDQAVPEDTGQQVATAKRSATDFIREGKAHDESGHHPRAH
jgi:hypothetical protein